MYVYVIWILKKLHQNSKKNWPSDTKKSWRLGNKMVVSKYKDESVNRDNKRVDLYNYQK